MNRPPTMPARFFSPGIAVRRPATIASIPSRASILGKPGIALSASPASAVSENSVWVKPGSRQVTLTPVLPALDRGQQLLAVDPPEAVEHETGEQPSSA